ncbi:MAG: prepilin-type N-terminal cleavage/methylation domain-containing protein [Rhizobacter sp.]|nr:prepilin-type N-terminal cleavage/methylation domain-containing protein [Rhizobacter sp.]
MPTSARGSRREPYCHEPVARTAPSRPGCLPCGRRGPAASGPTAARGFTLIELMVVVALIAIATAVASLALRDPANARLEQEAARLASLLESARAEARASGVAAHWEPLVDQADGSGFRFVGLPAGQSMPTHWLEAGTSAQVIGARAVVLGPEPLIGAQRIVLHLGDHRLTLATDGIGPFAVANDNDRVPS